MSIFTDEQNNELVQMLDAELDTSDFDALFLKMLEICGEEVVAVNLDRKLHFAEPWAACDESLVDLPENDAGITYNKAFLVPLEVKNES